MPLMLNFSQNHQKGSGGNFLKETTKQISKKNEYIEKDKTCFLKSQLMVCES